MRGNVTGGLREAARLHRYGRRLVAACWALAILALGACSGSATAVPMAFPASDVARIDAIGAAAVAGGTPGIVVAIDDPVRGRFWKSYGSSSTAGTAFDPTMSYRIASVTKTFTALAVLRLVASGKVALDDPISAYVAGMPNGDRATVADLLAMRAGIASYTDDPTFTAAYDADPTLPGWTLEKTLALIQAHANDAIPPETQTIYSNSEYVLLGYVIAKAAGMPADRYINALVAQLGLKNTSFPSSTDLAPPFVHGYDSYNGAPPVPLRDVSRNNPVVPWTAGAMVSTVPDMLQYAKLMGTGVGLPPALWAKRQTWTQITTHGLDAQYGYGISRVGAWLGHDGGIQGYGDFVMYAPSSGVSIVVMGNDTAVPIKQIWADIVQALYPGTISFLP